MSVFCAVCVGSCTFVWYKGDFALSLGNAMAQMVGCLPFAVDARVHLKGTSCTIFRKKVIKH